MKWQFEKGGSPDGVYNTDEWQKLPRNKLLVSALAMSGLRFEVECSPVPNKILSAWS